METESKKPQAHQETRPAQKPRTEDDSIGWERYVEGFRPGGPGAYGGILGGGVGYANALNLRLGR